MGASTCKGTCGLGAKEANLTECSVGGRAPSREAYKVHEFDHCGNLCNKKVKQKVDLAGIGGSSSSTDPHGAYIGGGADRNGKVSPSNPGSPEHNNLSLSLLEATRTRPGNGDAAGGSLAEGGTQYGGPGNSENYWNVYFSREASELQSLPRPRGAAVSSRRKHVFQTGAIYDGEWLGNERWGFGMQTWPDGAEYRGQWSANTATGRGCFRHCDGDVYTGEWRQNLAHGNGVYHHRDGTTYEGQFVDDMQDGYGVESWPDRSQYFGRFNRGRKSDYGTYVWPDGSQYTGSWFANRIDGFGFYVGSDNRRYDGKWKGSAMHGCGRYCWPDGRTYLGQYVTDQKDGFGAFTWINGRRYDGYWASGKQHGIGVLSLKGSVSRMGRWVYGERLAWTNESTEDWVSPK